MKNDNIPSLLAAVTIGAVFSLTSVSATNTMESISLQKSSANNIATYNLVTSREYTNTHNGTLSTLVVNNAVNSDK